MKTECLYCHAEYEAERASSKFCSESCKKRFQRERLPVLLDEVEKSRARVSLSNREIKSEPVFWSGPSLGEPQPDGSFKSKLLLTGRATPGLMYPGWSRPKYWLRLRDLPGDEQGPFHTFLKGRNNPVDPTLPTEEQDFYHPWAYSEWKNPPHPDYASGKADMTKEPLVPMTIPKGETPEQIKVRLGRIRDYNSTMEPRHHLSESKLRAILKKGGYSPDLARQVFSKSKPSTAIPE